MNTTAFFVSPKILRRMHVGPLGAYIDDFAALLQEQGYSQGAAQGIIRTVAKWSRWLYGRHVDLADVNVQLLERYLVQVARAGVANPVVRPTLHKMLAWLQNAGAVRMANSSPVVCQIETERNAFGLYLEQKRGLSPTTLKCYLPYISQFLVECFEDKCIEFDALVAEDVTGFVQRNSHCLHNSSTKHLVTALRTFLRYLRHMGRISIDLAACVPAVANWSFSTLPKCLNQGQVEHILAHCDQSTPKGRRDYAILLLLARLGLRAGEVAALKFEDIDWEQGYFTIRSKGGRWTSLPILDDVGNAISNYLTNGRPSCPDRHVFIHELAPRKGFAKSSCISGLVRKALLHAGIESPRKGAHLLRHSLATDMLRNGASLKEIGEVLRHRSPDTTQLYAKVDFTSLQCLALPWPGGEQ